MASRLLYAGLVLALLVGAVAIRLADPAPIARLRLMVFDTYQQLSPRAYDPRLPVRVIDIDEASLKRYGQWPWPRTVLATLTRRLAENGAAVIAFNFVMGEPDRELATEIVNWLPDDPAAAQIARQLEKLPSGDAVFADAMRAAPVVLSFVAINDSATLPVQRGGFAHMGDDPRLFVPAFTGAVASLPLLEERSAGSGAHNWVPEHDQVIRRLPLLVRVGDRLYPSFAAEALRVAEGAETYLVKASGASSEEAFGRATGITAVRIGRYEIPTDASGQMWLRFTRTDPRRMIPAIRVLDGEVERRAIEGHIVFVGIRAASLLVTRTTPLEVAMTGAEVQAQAIEQILAGSHLLRPDFATGAEILLLVLGGLALAIVTYRAHALWSALVGAVVLVGAVAGSWWAFKTQSLLLDPVYPWVSLSFLYLSATIYRYRQTEAERRRVRDAFGRYMAPALVDELAANPRKLKLGGEMRNVTLMFCDVRGFTSLSERLTPEELVGLLNRYLAAMVEVIDRYGGTIDEFIGDAIFVLFGAPLWAEDDAERAVACALAMQLAMPAVNEANRRQGLPELEMGIGIHTGQVVVGNIGSPERMKYGVVGSHVNLASRIQSYSTGGQILVSQSTRRETGALLRFGRQLEVKAKGVEHPIVVFEVLGIEGRHKLFLPEAAAVLVELVEAVPFKYAVVEEAQLGKERFEGRLIKLGPRAAEAQLESPIAVWTNIEMHLVGPDGQQVPGALYAKVVARDGAAYALRFTSVSPEAQKYLHGVASPSGRAPQAALFRSGGERAVAAPPAET